jgi:hypothetical protein
MTFEKRDEQVASFIFNLKDIHFLHSSGMAAQCYSLTGGFDSDT